MVNEGDKEEMGLQGNDDIVLIIIVKCKVGKWFQVNKFIWLSLFIILKQIGFFQNCWLLL